MTFVAAAIGVGTALIGAKSQKDTNKSNRKAAKDASQPKLLKEVQPDVKRLLGDTRTGGERETFEGRRVAPLSPNQQEGLGMVDALRSLLEQQQGTVGQGFTDFASGANIGRNPFIEDQIRAIEADAEANLQRNLLPNIQNQAVGGGGVGGTRQGVAQGIALGDTNRAVTSASADLRANQTQNDIANQLNALTNQGNILSGQSSPLDLLLNTGALQQGQNQAQITSRQDEFNERQTQQFDRDQQLLSILLGTPVGQPVVPQVTDPLAAGLGTALTASQLFGGRTNQAPAQVQPLPQIPRGVSPTGADVFGTPF